MSLIVCYYMKWRQSKDKIRDKKRLFKVDMIKQQKH